MVGIQGVSGVPEPSSDRPSGARDTSKTPPPSSGGDDSSSDQVAISSQAQAAAVVAKTLQASASASDVRQDRVEAAKAALERGDYKNPEVVATVADRISKFI